MCLTTSIQTKTAANTNACTLWNDLKRDYATSRTLLVFSEFQGVMNTRISSDSHLVAAIDKIMTHYEVLQLNQLAIPDSLKALIILSKLFSHYNFVAQNFLYNIEMSVLDV